MVSLPRRIGAILLALSLFSSSTPAAPKTIVNVVQESQLSLWLWYHSIGLASLIHGQGNGKVKEQEKQRDRDEKINRVEIYPSDGVTVDLGERVRFAAVAYDLEDNSIGGVKIKWSGENIPQGPRVRISKDGEFQATAPGSFTVVAQAAGRSAKVNVVVRPGDKPDLKAPVQERREISTRDNPAEAAANKPAKTQKRATNSNGTKTSVAVDTKRAHASRAVAPKPMWISNGWDSTNYWSADDPGNAVGNPPGTSPENGAGAGSGNFQFKAPVLALPGRGMNVALELTYNSRLWNKATNQINYDNDKGWPAPGFSFGFGKLLGMTIPTGCMLVDADGTRHSYTGSITFYSWGTVGVMHTTDGSLIDYTYQTGTNGVITYAQARHPNGTTVSYGAYSQPGGGVFPTFIEDANGNYITITYVNNQGPRIQTVTDTLGRVINFHYNGSNLLTAVTAPGLGGGTRTLTRLHYKQLTINPGFSGLTANVPNYYPWVIDAIYYPGTGTGYWLNDSDSYSSYGMLAKVVEQRSIGFSASSLTDMGSISAGSVTRKEEYNYPLTPNYSLTDAPTYTQMIETWSRDGSNFDSATTAYETQPEANPRVTITTLPNGTKSKQLAYNAPGQYYDGLVYRDELYVTEGQPLQVSASLWQQGAYGSPRPYRIEKTDERGQITATEFSYGSVYNQITDVRDYNYGGSALVRSTRTTYQNNANYTGTCYSYGCYGRHIFNLPLTVEVYGSDNVTRLSRTEYQYDGQTLTAAPNVVMHDQSHNPHADAEGFCYWDYDWNDPDCTGSCWDYNCDGYCNQIWNCPYDYSTEYRGNITQITRYANAVGLTGAVSETRRYDVTGNQVKSSTSCCEQTTSNYTIDTQYAYPLSKTRGSATDPYKQVITSGTYDFNTGLGLSATDANGRTSTTAYDTNSLRPARASFPTGTHTDYTYDDAGMSISQATYLETHPTHTTTAEQRIKYLNGRGQTRQEKVLAVGGAWDIVDIVYGNMGQVIKQTAPYRTTAPNPSLMFYDALGRTTKVIAPDYTQPDGSDGSTTETFYNEAARPSVASTTAGETTRVKDAWGRERWGRTDASGRLVEVVEPDPNGAGSVATNGMVTNYTYNTLGNLTQTVQGDQTRTFKYDSLGRLTAQKLAEQSATLNDAGTYVGSGSWTSVFTYDDRSNVTSRTDARGVKIVYTYNSDPLNRLQSISWDTSGFGDTANPILAAPTVTYSYRTKSSGSQLLDVTQFSSISTAGVSTESFGFDSEGRVSSRTLTLSSRPSYPFVTDYVSDSLDRISNVVYPAQYSNGGGRKTAQYNYDVASRLGGLTYNGQTFASNIVYNAASQTTSLSIGTGTNQVTENYGYEAQTGLLSSQTLTRNGSTLLNLSYDYLGTNGRRSGQLAKITNNLDNNKNRGYQYDALGRLKRATGGQNVNWVQRYYYDRYGNRTWALSHTAEQYVRNFYQKALDRQPNSTELNSWLSTLQTAYAQGTSQFWTAMQNLGGAVFTSQEYANRNRTDHWYVYDLYQAYLWRDPDAGGWAHWEANTASVGRNATRAGFDWSVEFEMHVNGTSPFNPPGGATVPGDGWASLHYDNASNRINDGGWGYDAAGNQTRAFVGLGWQRYQYDAANRLVRVKADDNTTVVGAYTYADSNERLIAEESGTRTYYVAEGGATMAEYTETGGSTTPAFAKGYVYLGNRLISSVSPTGGGGEAIEYQHPDRLGTRVVTNPSTGGSFEQVTLPFGTALTSESTGATKRRFTSYERSDVTKLDYAVNRSYDSQQGRFTQVDPAGMNATSATSPQTLNLYAYCSNDPVNRVDPSGLGLFSFIGKIFNVFKKILKWVLIAVAIAFAIVAIVAGPITALAMLLKIGSTVLGKLGILKTSPIIMNIASGTVAGGGVTLGVTGQILTAAMSVGAVASHFQCVECRPKKINGATQEQFDMIIAAVDDLVNRIKNNKDCADMLGGKDKALKALKDSTISVEPLRAEAVIPDSGPFAGKVLHGTVEYAKVVDKTIKIGSNTVFAPDGVISVQNIATGKPVQIQGTPADINEVGAVLAHETAHRTKSKKIVQDDSDAKDSQANQAKVKAACGY